VNFTKQELVLPEGNPETMPQWIFTAYLWKELFPEGKIYMTEDTRVMGLGVDQMIPIVRNISSAIGLFAAEGGENELRPTDSFVAKLYLDLLTKKYKSRFINLLRTEKLPNMDQFMAQIRSQPIMKGKTDTQSYSYMRLWYQILGRVVKFDWQKDKFSDQLSQNFMDNYIKSSIVKETLQEALKENRIKVINLNSFNSVLFEHESNFIDILEIETPENFAQFFAKSKARYDKGDYTVCNEIHKFNADVKGGISDLGLECLFKRLKARNRIAGLKETELQARKAKTDKYKLPLTTYIQQMTMDELKLFRPLGFTLAADGLVDKYDNTSVSKTFWNAVSKGTGPNVIIKFDFSEIKFTNWLDKILIKEYPDKNRKEFETNELYQNDIQSMARFRSEIRERQLVAAREALPSLDILYEAGGSINKVII
jgi:hypothetical protein